MGRPDSISSFSVQFFPLSVIQRIPFHINVWQGSYYSHRLTSGAKVEILWREGRLFEDGYLM